MYCSIVDLLVEPVHYLNQVLVKYTAMNPPSEQSVQSTSLPETDDSYDFLFKIVLIGDAGVGKTCAVQRFKHGVYIERYGNTIGVDFMLKTVEVEGKRIKVSHFL